jgi:zinc transporter 1/2/3
MRHLLGPAAAHDQDHHDADAHNTTQSTVSTLDLRVAAVFFIFAASLLGALPPVLLLRRRQGRLLSLDSPAARVLQSFAGATIAALAIVHVAPVAVETLAAIPLAVPYDHLGGAVVLVGLFLTISADGLLAARAAPKAYKDALRAALLLTKDESETTTPAKDGTAASAVIVPPPAAATAENNKDPQAATTTPVPALPTHHHHHHVCARALSEQRLTAVALAVTGPDGTTPVLALHHERRAALLAYSLELGCVLHSLLIGVAVGVSVAAPRSAVAALAAAVAVHQLVEGVALGCALARAPFSRLRASGMALLYSITTPAGVALGIAVSMAAAYDPDSVVALALTGVFSGLSAGLLLYLGLCQVMLEELSKEDLLVRPGLRYAVHGAALLGGALMCVLALWA